MNDVPLVDLSPTFRLALMALVIATLPLSWVWLRQRGRDTGARIAALTAVTLFLTFDLIVFGAFTRLTDSGLGCPDWPGCYGDASPFGAHMAYLFPPDTIGQIAVIHLCHQGGAIKGVIARIGRPEAFHPGRQHGAAIAGGGLHTLWSKLHNAGRLRPILMMKQRLARRIGRAHAQ